MPLYPPKNHPEKPHKEIIDGHYHLPNNVPINLDCLAEDCVYFDKKERPEKNCKRGHNGSLTLHIWGFCKYYKEKKNQDP